MLTPDQIQVVTETLARTSNLGVRVPFDTYLLLEGKRWLCERLALNALAAEPGVTPTQLEAAIRAAITRAAMLIEIWAPMQGLLSPATESPQSTSLNRTLYRAALLHQVVPYAIAIQPDLLISEHERSFERIVSQRLRIAERMYFDVNTDRLLRAFSYPGAASHQLSTSASRYWDPEPRARWVLSKAGRDYPAEAISQLFVPSTKEHRNLVYCQHAASAVLLDALLPLHEGSQYDLASLARIPGYFFLDVPFENVTSPNYINDSSGAGRFEQVLLPLDDLQVGDYVYAENPDFYSLVQPDGLWSGEHSFVMRRSLRPIELGSKEPGLPGDDLWFSGLGLHNVSMNGLRNTLLQELNKSLEEVRTRVRTHRALNNGTNGPRSLTHIDLTERREGEPFITPLTILRDLDLEDRIPATQHEAAWYVQLSPGALGTPRHYLWRVNMASREFNYWNEEFDSPQPTLPNDFSLEDVWSRKHPLRGKGDRVMVIRPKLAE